MTGVAILSMALNIYMIFLLKYAERRERWFEAEIDRLIDFLKQRKSTPPRSDDPGEEDSTAL
jgi:hypothetical protein